MLRTMRLGLLTAAAALAVSAAPAAAAERYTMFLPGGSPVAAAPTSAEAFMDYTDDSVTRRGLATKSGGEVISDFTVDHPVSSNQESV